MRGITFAFRLRIVRGDFPAWLVRHPRKAYIVQLLLATPPWANLAEIRRLDKEARARSASTGRRYVVDHIIPLTHKRVCGLNTPANLHIIDTRVNAAKSNHWCEWHGELFSEPEQFTLWGSEHAKKNAGSKEEMEKRNHPRGGREEPSGLPEDVGRSLGVSTHHQPDLALVDH